MNFENFDDMWEEGEDEDWEDDEGESEGGSEESDEW